MKRTVLTRTSLLRLSLNHITIHQIYHQRHSVNDHYVWSTLYCIRLWAYLFIVIVIVIEAHNKETTGNFPPGLLVLIICFRTDLKPV